MSYHIMGAVMEKRYIVKLSASEREECERVIRRGKNNATVIRRAHMLLAADESEERQRVSDKSIGERFGVCRTTVEGLRQRFVENAFSVTLYGKKRETAPKKLTGEVEAHVIAVSRSHPESGTQGWTLHRIAARVVELQVVDSLSHESVRTVLKKTASGRAMPSSG
jgi:transposase